MPRGRLRSGGGASTPSAPPGDPAGAPSDGPTRAADAGMTAATAGWTGWWIREDVNRARDWRENAQVLFDATVPLLAYGPDDVVLDLGGGPGHLGDLLLDRVREVHLADVRASHLDAFLERHPGRGDCFVHPLDPERYLDLAALPRGRLTVAICCSVVQYYRDVDEVRALVRAVLDLLAPGGRFLLADLPPAGGRWRDAFALLGGAARRGSLRRALSWLWRLRRSDYDAVRHRAGLLRFGPEDLASVAAAATPPGRVLDRPLTLLARRRHVLFEKPA